MLVDALNLLTLVTSIVLFLVLRLRLRARECRANRLHDGVDEVLEFDPFSCVVVCSCEVSVLFSNEGVILVPIKKWLAVGVDGGLIAYATSQEAAAELVSAQLADHICTLNGG